MSPHTVVAAPDAQQVASSVLSSLPVSFSPTHSDSTAELSVIAGAADWPVGVATALRQGYQGVVVLHPQPGDLTTLPDLTDLPVVLDHVWASNPAVAEAAPHVATASARADLLECRLTVADDDRPLPASLSDAAALVRALLGPLSRVSVLHHDDAGFIASSTVDDLAVSISVQRSSALAPHAYVRVLTQDGGIELAIPHPGTARPAEIVITDPTGVHTLPTIWESAHRTAWRRIRDLLDNSTPVEDLTAFAADQNHLAAALDRLSSRSRPLTVHHPSSITHHSLNEEPATTSPSRGRRKRVHHVWFHPVSSRVPRSRGSRDRGAAADRLQRLRQLQCERLVRRRLRRAEVLGHALGNPRVQRRRTEDHRRLHPGPGIWQGRLPDHPVERLLPDVLLRHRLQDRPGGHSGAGFQAFQFAEQGQIAYADNLIESIKSDPNLEFLPGLVDTMKTPDGYAGVPWQTDVRPFWYNQALLDEAGAKAPTTWDELLSAGQALKKIGVSGFATGAGAGNNLGAHTMVAMMINNGGGLFDADGKPDAVTDANIEAMQFIQQLAQEGIITKGAVSYTQDNLDAQWNDGKAAIGIHTPGLAARVAKVADNLHVASPLTSPSGTKAGLIFVNNLMMYTNTPSQEASEAFLKYYLGQIHTYWEKPVGVAIPALTSITKSANFTKDPNQVKIVDEWIPVSKTYAAQKKESFAALASVDGGQALSQFAQTMLQGTTDPKAALTTLQQGLEAVVK